MSKYCSGFQPKYRYTSKPIELYTKYYYYVLELSAKVIRRKEFLSDLLRTLRTFSHVLVVLASLITDFSTSLGKSCSILPLRLPVTLGYFSEQLASYLFASLKLAIRFR